MKKVKLILEQTFMLSFLIQVVMSLEALYSRAINYSFGFPWYTPLSCILASFLCSLPTLILIKEKESSGPARRILPILHFVLLYVLVMGLGYVFHWYSNLTYFIITTIAYFVIYAIVWTLTLLSIKYDEKLINDALLTIQDED